MECPRLLADRSEEEEKPGSVEVVLNGTGEEWLVLVKCLTIPCAVLQEKDGGESAAQLECQDAPASTNVDRVVPVSDSLAAHSENQTTSVRTQC